MTKPYLVRESSFLEKGYLEMTSHCNCGVFFLVFIILFYFIYFYGVGVEMGVSVCYLVQMAMKEREAKKRGMLVNA